VGGIPVREVFRREAMQPDDGARHLLIMGGGLGLLPRSDRFYEELDAPTGGAHHHHSG
jgi:UDP-N-acetylglucosamine:LPS N-acetylglucosamine transferase